MDHEGNADRVCDLRRAMVVVSTILELAKVLEVFNALHNQGVIRLVRVKDRIAMPAAGWRDVMVNFYIAADQARNLSLSLPLTLTLILTPTLTLSPRPNPTPSPSLMPVRSVSRSSSSAFLVPLVRWPGRIRARARGRGGRIRVRVRVGVVGLGLELRSGLGLELGLGLVPGRPAITLSSSSAPSAPPMRLSRTCRKPLNLDSIGLVSRATWLGIGLGLGFGLGFGFGLGLG